MKFSVVTWNVNSVRARIKNVVEFLKNNESDVLCMQETKVENRMFPKEEFENLGYNIALFGQKRFNGVATVSKKPFDEVKTKLFEEEDKQRRVILTKINDITIINSYFPNGKSPESDNFRYKLEFINGFRKYIENNYSSEKDKIIIVGDFNVAKEEIDVYDVNSMVGKIGFHPKEREALLNFYNWGFTDAFRLFNKEQEFSWWDYRLSSFKRNIGLRIDYIWISKPLINLCTNCYIDTDERGKEKPSDHAPMVASFDI